MRYPISTEPWYSCMLTVFLLLLAGCQSPHHATSEPSPPFTSIILREGDILKVSFPGAPNLSSSQQIRRDGKIVLPMGGELRAAGLTPDQLQAELLKTYGSQLVSKEVIVTVEASVYDVFVTGAVLRPGKIMVNRPITALEAVMEAGGFDYAKANARQVAIIRNDGDKVQNFRVDLKLLMEGLSNRAFYLRPSDIVYVPEKFSFF